jgi:hypothetical protein
LGVGKGDKGRRLFEGRRKTLRMSSARACRLSGWRMGVLRKEGIVSGKGSVGLGRLGVGRRTGEGRMKEKKTDRMESVEGREGNTIGRDQLQVGKRG